MTIITSQFENIFSSIKFFRFELRMTYNHNILYTTKKQKNGLKTSSYHNLETRLKPVLFNPEIEKLASPFTGLH